MDDFFVRDSKDGFTMKLWSGEGMCLLGFDVEHPEADLGRVCDRVVTDFGLPTA